MDNILSAELKFICIFFLFISIPFLGKSQGKPKLFFKEGDTIRIEPNSANFPEATVTVVVPKHEDDKNDKPNQNILKGGRFKVAVDLQNSTVEQSKVKFPIINEFSLDSLTETQEFSITFTAPRDIKDDKTLVLKLIAENKQGKEIIELRNKITVYVKPLNADILSSNKHYELWFLTGTNFDLFDGVKPQEFFFRTNTLFKISKMFFAQVAFYKNRYYSADTTSGSLPFNNVKRPSLGDTLFTLTTAKYRRTTSQTNDPLALQFDLLFKLTEGDDLTSNFFITAGFDISTTTVTIKNNYTYSDTTLFLKTSKPDTVKGFESIGSAAFPELISYKKPAYNFNVGFMWILDENDVNIKAQLTGGLSKYTNLRSFYQSRGAGTIYNFELKKNIPYVQTRLFATYKPIGLSFGLEAFIRRNEVPAFNFTLAKAFDIKGFIKNFTPVTGLKL